MLSPLHVITVVFNPRRFASRYRLYRNFADWIGKAGVRLLTVEVAFGQRPFEVTEENNPHHVQLRTNDELWHKERALNLGLQYLCQTTPRWEYVAWMDADIKLLRDDWAAETVHLLQHYAVLQMFGEASNLDPDNHQLWLGRSIMRNYEDYGEIDWYDHPGLTFRDKTKKFYPRAGHPGLAWAFRRPELEGTAGWLDTCVNGSGDLHMVGCYAGRPDLALPSGIHPGYRDSILRFGAKCDKHVRRNASYMPGVAVHYWHGKTKQRGYEDRGNLLVKHQYNPQTDIEQDIQGLYRWSGNKPCLAVETRKSLRKRNEDTIEV
jgi:hypothetical protein